MSKITERLEKLADKFERSLVKKGQEAMPLQEPIISDVYAFQTWLDTNFPSSAKNKIANEIANAVTEDLNTLSISLGVANKMLQVSALVNGSPNKVATDIVKKYVGSKISGALASFPDKSKYTGWITYPK